MKIYLINFFISAFVFFAGFQAISKFAPQNLNPGINVDSMNEIIFVDLSNSFDFLVNEKSFDEQDAQTLMADSLEKMKNQGFIILNYSDALYAPSEKVFLIGDKGLINVKTAKDYDH